MNNKNLVADDKIAEQLTNRELYTVEVTTPFGKPVAYSKYASPLQLDSLLYDAATNRLGQQINAVTIKQNEIIVRSFTPSKAFSLNTYYVLAYKKRNWYGKKVEKVKLFTDYKSLSSFRIWHNIKETVYEASFSVLAYGEDSKALSYYQLLQRVELCR